MPRPTPSCRIPTPSPLFPLLVLVSLASNRPVLFFSTTHQLPLLLLLLLLLLLAPKPAAAPAAAVPQPAAAAPQPAAQPAVSKPASSPSPSSAGASKSSSQADLPAAKVAKTEKPAEKEKEKAKVTPPASGAQTPTAEEGSQTDINLEHELAKLDIEMGAGKEHVNLLFMGHVGMSWTALWVVFRLFPHSFFFFLFLLFSSRRRQVHHWRSDPGADRYG